MIRTMNAQHPTFNVQRPTKKCTLLAVAAGIACTVNAGETVRVDVALAEKGGAPTICSFVEATFIMDADTGKCRNAYRTMPALNSGFTSLPLSSARLSGNSLKAWFSVNVHWPGEKSGKRYRFVIDSTVKGDAVSGSFKCSVAEDKREKSINGTVSGKVKRGGGKPAVRDLVAAGKNWPRWRGPFGNGTAYDCGEELVSSFREARLAWVSEDRTPDSLASKEHYTGGGFAPPLVVDGRVYLYYYRPNLRVCDEGRVASSRQRGLPARVRWGIETDDVIHCFDAATGKTLWRTAFAASGITLGSWTKTGGLLAACYADGRVYALGTGCRVCAVDAKTGAALWQSNVGIRAEYQAHYTRLSCKNRAVPYFNRDLGSAVVEADGVVACVDHVSHYRGPRYGCGLVGFDGATGRRLWHIDECTAWWGMPLKWSQNGKEYIVSPGGGRGTTCIEPRTGKILWELKGRAGGQMCLVSGDLLLVDGGGGTTCFRMSPLELGNSGSEVAVSMPRRPYITTMPTCPRRRA